MVNAKYPRIKEGSEGTQEKTKPIHDTTSHYRTATEYYFDNEPMIKVSQRQENQRPREKWDPIQGKMRVIQQGIQNKSPFHNGKRIS